ncbi:4504_t:CDS:2, partial [Racocetra fulgida]
GYLSSMSEQVSQFFIPLMSKCLGFKTPKEAIDGHYIDKKCPWTGMVSIRGRILTGVVVSVKMKRTIIVRREYLHYVTKYNRYEKRHKNLAAHLSPAFVGVSVSSEESSKGTKTIYQYKIVNRTGSIIINTLSNMEDIVAFNSVEIGLSLKPLEISDNRELANKKEEIILRCPYRRNESAFEYWLAGTILTDYLLRIYVNVNAVCRISNIDNNVGKSHSIMGDAERQEMQPPQQQSTSSFNIMSILNPAPSPPSHRSQTVLGTSLQQDSHAHPTLPPASSMTQQTYYQSSPHSQAQSPTFQISSNSPVNIYGYTPQKSTFSPVGFNASSNGTPLSPVKTSPSTPLTNAPTVLQSSHVLMPSEISIPAVSITAYNNRSPSLSPTIQEQDVTASINKSNHHHNGNSSEVNQVTVATTPILSDSCGHLTKDQPPTPTLTPVEFVDQSVQKSGYVHQNLNQSLNAVTAENSSGLEQLASTALCELQNLQRRDVIHNEETRTGRESDVFSDEGHISHPTSPFEERTPVKNIVSPISYESTTGSTPAPPQTDSEFPQYDHDEPMKGFGETTDSESEPSKSEFTRINKTSHVKGKDLQNKRRYKINQKNHEEVSSDDAGSRQRKSGTRRPKATLTKRKLSFTSDRTPKDNKRQFRSRTTSNNSSRNTSPSLGSTNANVVDEMVIDEPERSGEQLYCVCRSSDGQSFMIECDNCDEWFHGACVKISSEESLMVDKFYCPNCTARFEKLKFCSVKCGMDFNRILLEKEERAAKMKLLLSKKNKDNKKGPIKRNVTNRTGQLEDVERLKRIAKKEAKIKKELEEIETLNNVAGRGIERVQSESDQVDSDGSAQDAPCEFEKQSESDGPTHNAPICGYSPRFDWAIDKDDVKYVEEEICTIQKARCKKHRNWQKLAGEKRLIKAQMRKRNDMEEAIINETIDHMAGW